MKKPTKKITLRDSKNNVVAMYETPTYARGADAPDEMRRARYNDDDEMPVMKQHILSAITYAETASNKVRFDAPATDEEAIAALHHAASCAFKAIAILRRRRTRDEE